ncbi:MAG TPA: hypothetical protein VN598_02775 [Usitatibacter sp.]|nr:hypothetical protein [Usitatibacter sp.]
MRATLFLFASTLALAGGEGFDTPPPPKDPPYEWPNAQGRLVTCDATPWQLIDLGKIGPVRIYAGDHCSVPMSDPLSEHYKALFSDSCDLHDICYLTPGNTKRWCDDALLRRTERDCDRAYPDERAWRTQCRITAKAWRIGLETPISTTYWDRSQAWGRANCRLAPR